MPVSFIITARQLVTATNTSVLISYRTYNGMYNISYVKVVCLYTYNRIYTVILLVKKKTSRTHYDPIVTANIVLDLKDTPIH